MTKRPFLFTTLSLLLAPLIALLSLQGCSTLSYYQQAIAGQFEILNKRQDITALTQHKDTPPELKQKLETVLQVRTFAHQEMQMDVGDSYSQYSDVQRDYVVWNLSASPELSLSPHQWCYPIIGCQSYRGYFHQTMAEAEANKLQQQGYDTWVGGVSAYSTLGWFDDPVLNTFVYRSNASLAALLIHELSHQILYIKGDTAFNESFATAVELEGVNRWLTATSQEYQIDSYHQKVAEKNFFIEMVLATNHQLKTVYDSPISDSEKRIKKRELIAALQASYQLAIRNQQVKGYFSHWFKEVNNAKLITISNYYKYVPAFTAMIKEAKGNMHAFYQSAIALGSKEKHLRDEILQQYLSRSEGKTNNLQH